MSLIFYLTIGAIVGLLLMSGRGPAAGILPGIVIAWLLYVLRDLTRRVSALEHKADATVDGRSRVSAEPGRKLTPESTSAELPPGPAAVQSDARLETAAQTVSPSRDRSETADTREPFSAWLDQSQSTPADRLIARIRGWFTTGNVPVRVGVIVSFFGFAFLFKYAVDQRLLNLPVWLRLAFAALFGLGLLFVGWRLRNRQRVYALSLQGGGIGIVYLTVFAAFRLFQLLPPVPAFILLALITVATAVLAVSQDARAMAVLGVTGGFLAPILASTGQGSHVALFSYYLLLNLMIVGIAWFKSWRELNLVGFLFTFVVGTAWGYRFYRPEYLASTEPFLIAHFALYQIAVILFALRQPPRLRGVIDGTLIFGTPVVAFGIQAALLDQTRYGLAYSAVALAIIYAGIAWALSGRDRAMALLRDVYVVLGVAFTTVAVPLFLDANWTAATWAMEGAALVWLSVRQPNLLSRVAGVALIVLAGGSFVVGGWENDSGLIVLNRNVLGGVLLSLAGFVSAHSLNRIEHRAAVLTAMGLFVWGVVWWILTGSIEIEDRLRHSLEYPVLVSFFAISGVLLSFFGRLLDWRLARYGSLVLLPLLAFALSGRGIVAGHPFESNAAAAWALAGVAHLYVLKPFSPAQRIAEVWHGAGVFFAAWLFAWEINWWIVVETWRNVSIGLMLSLLAAICCWGDRIVKWPLQSHRVSYVLTAGLMLGSNLLFITAFSFDSPGDPLPYPYFPLLNPYTLVALAAIVPGYLWIIESTAVFGFGGETRRVLLSLLGFSVFVLSTIAVVRGVHHYADVPWRQYTLIRSVEVQAALSIFWALLSFVAMVRGARRNLRWLWLTGAGLMALVVLKLFFIDLGNSGTVARIVSFIGVGALLLVVGYFAPVPPRDAATTGDGA